MTQIAELNQYRERRERDGGSRGPQVEEGYTRIANELYEVLNNRHACPINVRHLCLVHAIIRRTYGFNKTMDAVADTQLAADTGIPRQKVNAAKHELLAMKVLKLSDDGRKLGVNKQYAEWDFSKRPERKAPQAKRRQDGDSVTKMVTQEVTKTGTHKRQKDIPSTVVEGSAPKSRNTIDFSEFSGDIDEQALRDFAQHRKALRKPLTQRALRSIVKMAQQCEKQVNITAVGALDVAMASGWLKVEPQWLLNAGYAQRGDEAEGDIPACPHAELLAAWDRALGARKGGAPAPVDWKGTRMAAKLEALWRKNWNATNPSGAVRYSTVEEGIEWWSRVFTHLAGSQNFLQSDVTLNNLFNPDTFALAVKGNLRHQGGATR